MLLPSLGQHSLPHKLQRVYQTFVFFSRSSVSMGLPPLPEHLLPLPATIQGVMLATLVYKSVGFLLWQGSNTSETKKVFFVFLLVCLEGIYGGLA
jgi:battenin